MVRRRPIFAATCAVLITFATLGAGRNPPLFHAPAAAGTAFAASRFAGSPGAGTIYASNFYPSAIEIYAAGQPGAPLIGAIYNGISSSYNVAVDSAGTLYVANNDCTVTEFPRGALTPSKVLSGPCTNGTGVVVAVGPNGTVYLTDHYDGLLFEFAHGSTSATTTIFVPQAFGLAVDAKNNVYVSYTSPGRVEKFAPGKTVGKDLGISLSSSGGLAIDAAGHLLVGDQGPSTIGVYTIGSTKPIRTISTSPVYPYEFVLNAAGKTLYVASGQPNGVYVYDYLSGKPLGSIDAGYSTQDYTTGVAIDPPLVP